MRKVLQQGGEIGRIALLAPKETIVPQLRRSVQVRPGALSSSNKAPGLKVVSVTGRGDR